MLLANLVDRGVSFMEGDIAAMPDRDMPITTGTVLRWTGLIAGTLGIVISIVWWAASVNTRMTISEASVVQLQRQIDKLTDRADGADRDMNEVKQKVGLAVQILERIDKRVGIP